MNSRIDRRLDRSSIVFIRANVIPEDVVLKAITGLLNESQLDPGLPLIVVERFEPADGCIDYQLGT